MPCVCRGEHEIDYILFIQADVTLAPNPEEVSDTKYVSLPDLMLQVIYIYIVRLAA